CGADVDFVTKIVETYKRKDGQHDNHNHVSEVEVQSLKVFIVFLFWVKVGEGKEKQIHAKQNYWAQECSPEFSCVSIRLSFKVPVAHHGVRKLGIKIYT